MKLKSKKVKRSSVKSVEKSRKQIRKEFRKQKKINRSIYFKSKNESRATSAHASDSQADHKLANESVKERPKKCTKETKRRKSEDLERRRRKEKNRLLKAANRKEDKVIKRLEKQLKLNKRKKETISKSFVSDGLDYVCLRKDQDCIIEKEKQILENELNIDSMKKSNDIDTNDKDIWEDIYGRKRDKKGNIIDNASRYIPPAARINTVHSTNSDDEKLQSLRKQLKGCLNRVTEHNMYSIANQVEAMYMTNSRNNMNEVLSGLVVESLVSYVITPDRLISEYMMLIVILHANIGIEVGAHFLEKLVKQFIQTLEKSQDVANKELDNIILMISHLYNFKVFGYKLLYQILDKLVTKFTEKEIELILIILKTVGFSLRKDDPNALKEFIQSLQRKAGHETENNSRVKFMLEILLAIKNNNISKIPQYDPSHVEHLKKVMKSIIRKGNAITPFNVSLTDLLYADENGKWWIVGSAWSGPSNVNGKSVAKEHKFNFGTKILELARKQRMNTDIRKNIFCILMTAEDYLDAFEKLHHLDLKDQQETEIIHVIMHCCLQENKFNPYYAVLAQKLCEYNRKYQLTIQYSLWDRLKTLETYENKQLSNLAQFLVYLFIEKCLTISILKIIHFTELERPTMKFLEQIILGILLHENKQACLQMSKEQC
ncbi:Nucleolar MIF4G domain-containing protein 1 [Melipona quadrifasciata]|uniref:Nucleolar MIF4G domain-containing protein 1 n=1 Tax=Melipona quadrifasciata TaxID=166423 RepID=A0A0N0U2Q6_9HYME|nr:Nucleolar MIF4G domain-containing protein 1 [Melipona quadrifasciata]